jgi:rhodanese-related sulfurtransferase
MYPGHGPGSACGKNIGKETQSTIGIQKQLNPALNTTDIETFINLMTEGLGTPPPYFFRDALINKQGYDPIDEVLQINMRGLDVVAFRQAIADGALVLDTRPSEDFEQGFIANALNIGLNGSFAQWVGALISIDQPLVLVTEPGREREAVLRLARIGFEHVRGYLEGGMENWKAQGGEVQTIRSIDASELKSQLTSVQILDVRNPGEYDNAHLPDARLVPLAKLPEHIEQLASSQPWYVHCAGGYRSMAAASVLKAHGIEAINIRGGMNKILEVGLPVVCLQS